MVLLIGVIEKGGGDFGGWRFQGLGIQGLGISGAGDSGGRDSGVGDFRGWGFRGCAYTIKHCIVSFQLAVDMGGWLFSRVACVDCGNFSLQKCVLGMRGGKVGGFGIHVDLELGGLFCCVDISKYIHKHISTSHTSIESIFQMAMSFTASPSRFHTFRR